MAIYWRSIRPALTCLLLSTNCTIWRKNKSMQNKCNLIWFGARHKHNSNHSIKRTGTAIEDENIFIYAIKKQQSKVWFYVAYCTRDYTPLTVKTNKNHNASLVYITFGPCRVSCSFHHWKLCTCSKHIFRLWIHTTLCYTKNP